MPDSDRIEVSRRIAAPARLIFAIVRDPRRHVDLDGSGMLLAAPDAKPLQGVGDTFEMHMDREPLGDLPLGKYNVICTVTSMIENAELAWTVAAPGKPSAGHIWGYRLEPITDRETEVTNYYDWSGVSQDWRQRFSWPVIPAAMFEQTLVNLDRIAIQANG